MAFTVGYPTGPSVAPVSADAPRLQTPDVSGLANLGAGIVNLGKAIDSADTEKAKRDSAAALNQLLSEDGDDLLNAQTLEKRNADGITPVFMDSRKVRREDISKTLSPLAKQMFDQGADHTAIQFKSSVASHETKEFRATQIDNISNRVDSLLKVWKADPTNIDIQHTALDGITAAADEGSQIIGADPVVNRQKFISAGIFDVVETLVKRGQPGDLDTAKALFYGNRKNLTGDFDTKIATIIQTAGEYDTSVGIVSKIMGKVYDGKKSEAEMVAEIDDMTGQSAHVREKAKQIMAERVGFYQKDDKRRLDTAEGVHWDSFNKKMPLSQLEVRIMADPSLKPEERGVLYAKFFQLDKARKDKDGEDTDEWRRNAMRILMNPQELASKTPEEIMRLEFKVGPKWHKLVVDEFRRLGKDGEVSISAELIKEGIAKSGKKGTVKDEDVLLAVEGTRAWADNQTSKPDRQKVMNKLIENLTPVEVEGRVWGTNTRRLGAVKDGEKVVTVTGVSTENLALIRHLYASNNRVVPTDPAELKKASAMLDREPETKKTLQAQLASKTAPKSGSGGGSGSVVVKPPSGYDTSYDNLDTPLPSYAPPPKAERVYTPEELAAQKAASDAAEAKARQRREDRR